MAKSRLGVMDAFIGKLGIVVGSIWKGIGVMRAYNKFPSNPNTDDQKLVRARFALLGKLAGSVYSAIKLGLKEYADSIPSTQSGEFVRINYGAISGSDPEALTVSYDELKLSKGNLPSVGFGTPSFTDPLEVNVPISNSNLEAQGANANDNVYVAIYCPDMEQGVLSSGTAKRSDNGVAVSVPASWQGMKVHVYGFVMAARSTGNPYKASATDYCGFGNIS